MTQEHRGNENPLVVFVHIPKAGGMSVTRILKEVYGDRLLVAHPERGWPQTWPDSTLKIIAEKRDFFAAFSGHFAYGIHDIFQRPARYFTTVREPFARLESYYNFVRRWEIHHHHKKATELDVVDFFRWMLANDDIELGNLQCLLIAGQKSFAAAKTRIDENFEYVLPIKRLSAALPILAEAYGWQIVPEVPRENQTEHSSTLSELPSGLFAELERANSEDQKLHDYCELRWAQLESGREAQANAKRG